MVKGEVGEFHHYLNIVQHIRMLIWQNWSVVLQHTLREGNSCADFLARKGSTSREYVTILANPPAGISHLLLADCMGIETPRV